jgi:hypothetical protein
MPTYEVKVEKDVLDRIAVAEAVHNFVLQAVPQRFKTDTDEKTIIVALFSLVVEHHGAILTLLKMGRFDGSAFALVRPLIDAVYRAFWVHFCAKPEHLVAIRNGDCPYPGLPNMADEVEKHMNYTGGLFTALKPHVKALHGYTHGGLEQLGRRFDSSGNVRPSYATGEKLEVVNSTTSYLVMLAVAWCQIVDGGPPEQEKHSAAIMERYNGLFAAHS